MNLICTNKGKFQNLTANRNYEGIEDGELYVVVNDIGARARYAKKYFRVAPEQPVAAARPAPVETPPPAPVIRPITDVVNVTVDSDEAIIRLTAGRGIQSVNHRLDINTTDISCGILQISGINNLQASIQSIFNRVTGPNVSGTLQDLVNKVMEEFFDDVRNDDANTCGVYLLSDVISEGSFVQQWLTANCLTSTTVYNPNSGNTITLWVMAGSNRDE